jgi:hypothetical protein
VHSRTSAGTVLDIIINQNTGKLLLMMINGSGKGVHIPYPFFNSLSKPYPTLIIAV